MRATDNMPTTNTTTDAGATLGRVLFYDVRLSINNTVACGSCHLQRFGFADTAQASRGFNGGVTARHAMALGNARFYRRARFFWDERAATLEDQVLQPIQNSIEMGMTLPALTTKLSATSFYAPLFTAAFGSSEVTSDRIARALAQFVRSLVTANSRFDQSMGGGAPLTPQEQQGLNLFNGRAGCARCHGTAANVSDDIHNTGLDATITDAGAGGGRFKAPSLRNVGVRGRFMHDGRFTSLEQVIDFYDNGVQNNPQLDGRLQANGPGAGGGVQRLGLNAGERAALVAFLNSLTDSAFLTEVKFSNPFRCC